MAAKPRNAFEEDKERREKAKRKFYTARREKMVRRRLGLTRQHQQIVIAGLNMALLTSPSIIRERWFISALNGRKYHFALLRYNLRSEDGRAWTTLQVQTHDANYGYMLSVTGLYSLKPA